MNLSFNFFMVFMVTMTLFLNSMSSSSSSYVDWETVFPNTSLPEAVKAVVSQNAYAIESNQGNWEDAYDVVVPNYGPGHCKVDGKRPLVAAIPPVVKTSFLNLKNFKVGAEVAVHLKSDELGITTTFPSADENELPIFQSSHLSNNLAYFSIKPNTKASKIMNLTLHMCESNLPMNGNFQYCARSLANLTSYVKMTLGQMGAIKGVSLVAQTDALMTYNIVRIATLATNRRISVCHHLGFPYTVFYCHQPHSTTAYEVVLRAKHNHGKVNRTQQAYVICHYKTGEWDPQYIGFKILSVAPGTPICHFIQMHDVLWYV